MSIAENLAAIRERIVSAAARAGRRPDQIALMAVTKTHPAERIIEAYEAGHRLFGENRVQEFAEKFPALVELRDADFHMIGHLQSNKAAKAVEVFHAIDSLDSVKLGERLNAAAAEAGKTISVLIEINIGGEDAKSGVAPDSPELAAILKTAAAWTNLRVRGLMAVPPVHRRSRRRAPVLPPPARAARPTRRESSADYLARSIVDGHVARLRSRDRGGLNLRARGHGDLRRAREAVKRTSGRAGLQAMTSSGRAGVQAKTSSGRAGLQAKTRSGRAGLQAKAPSVELTFRPYKLT